MKSGAGALSYQTEACEWRRKKVQAQFKTTSNPVYGGLGWSFIKS